jgi:hypothetical protein
MGFTAAGIGVSYATDLPTGPTIILIAGVTFLGIGLWRRLRRRWPAARPASSADTKPAAPPGRFSGKRGPLPSLMR